MKPTKSIHKDKQFLFRFFIFPLSCVLFLFLSIAFLTGYMQTTQADAEKCLLESGINPKQVIFFNDKDTDCLTFYLLDLRPIYYVRPSSTESGKAVYGCVLAYYTKAYDSEENGCAVAESRYLSGRVISR